MDLAGWRVWRFALRREQSKKKTKKKASFLSLIDTLIVQTIR
jgi:hypothetical protein